MNSCFEGGGDTDVFHTFLHQHCPDIQGWLPQHFTSRPSNTQGWLLPGIRPKILPIRELGKADRPTPPVTAHYKLPDCCLRVTDCGDFAPRLCGRPSSTASPPSFRHQVVIVSDRCRLVSSPRYPFQEQTGGGGHHLNVPPSWLITWLGWRSSRWRWLCLEGWYCISVRLSLPCMLFQCVPCHVSGPHWGNTHCHLPSPSFSCGLALHSLGLQYLVGPLSCLPSLHVTLHDSWQPWAMSIERDVCRSATGSDVTD